MSQSPADVEEESQGYSDGWEALYELLRQGKSFSGHERNCLYLNTGDGRFADASAVSGFDFADDARGLAVVDWDLDGALDLWLSARSAPRARFLRNSLPAGDGWVSFQLQGTTCNRDAVGARVELRVAGDERRHVRHLVAGDGFLSQSSKWLHFGLAEQRAIEAVQVRWPGGEREEFGAVAAGQRYRLVQGAARAEPWRPSRAVAQGLAERPTPIASEPPLARPPAASQLRLAAPLPLAGLSYQVRAEQVRAAEPRSLQPRGSWLLVNLWASWCPNCVRELREFATNAEQLREAGIEVLALSTDEAGQRGDADALLVDMAWPFEQGYAPLELVDALQVVLEVLLDQPREMALPTSFLIDPEGALRAVYRGPVGVDTLVAERRRRADTPEELRAGATPFQGRWISAPFSPRILTLAERLRRRGHVELAEVYTRNISLSAGDGAQQRAARKRLADTHDQLGRDLADRGQHEQAVAAFERALETEPERVNTLIELGNSLQALRRDPEARLRLEQALAIDPTAGQAHYAVGLLCAQSNDLERAREHFLLALEDDPRSALAQFNLGIVHANQQQLGPALQRIRTALEIDPAYLQASLTLAAILSRSGQPAEALAVYTAALQQHPDEPRLRLEFGLLLLEQGDRERAETQRRELVRLGSNLAQNLADELER